ncbi:enoyl-CoA hydratase [Chryseobacterium sp. LAM-KRS1]|uniref:enoyl-CoA hydratase n=1 Tax=Chryseobacterium sp. LAM-KRS1 TaxID=2715754 RepID=UPI001554A5E6|nr:enoyl-CoA hydratase [Chryseobacterium sp. LAM-KRS1]
MKTKKDIFNLIKHSVNLSDEFDNYHIRVSNGKFERENMIVVYKIRERIAIDNKNYKLADQLHQLIIGFESYSGILLKGVDICGKNYSGLFFFSEDWSKIIGYLED